MNKRPLQNRVDPFGHLIQTHERGAWMGNRGVLHNHHQKIIRPYKLKAWITCVLAFKDRHREVMSPDRYTELFFLDEATAFSAGHRPCAECRRESYNQFKKFWLTGNPSAGVNAQTPIARIDEWIHRERIDKHKHKKTHSEPAPQLPDGVMVVLNGHAFVKKGTHLQAWSPAGYQQSVLIPESEVDVLTPASIVNAFRAGYVPQIA